MRGFKVMANIVQPATESPREIAGRVGLFWRETIPAWQRLNLDIGPLLDQGLAELAISNLWGIDNRGPSQVMWQQAGEILEHGWLQLRAREKPRGYAGDHEMLGAIYQNRVTENPLGIAFDRYFLRQAAPQAVRNRMDLVRDEIVSRLRSADEPQKIVVLGSGSGLEVAAALHQLSIQDRARGEFWLLDLDPAAIALAEQNLQPLLPPESFHCLAENLVRLPGKPRIVEQLQNASLAICTGFFDYLEDDTAAALLKVFWQLLGPGGQSLVFNFAPWNPTRAYMEWIGNWYLIYRTRSDLAQLAKAADIPSNSIQVSAEASGVDLLLRLHKPA